MQRLAHDGSDPEKTALLFVSPAEGEDLLHQILLSIGRLEHLVERLVRRGFRPRFFQEHLRVDDDGVEDIVQVMGDPAGQPSQGLYLLHLPDLLLQQRLMGHVVLDDHVIEDPA
ncbi:MAG: hypothetical protein BWZ01_03089 [Deltaproteobacteria bacterium ADurb.BinA179]|nr:MAG: hypothetical protein BWZ01_03089 [Deltaproteobacteria bacterium ADurb.BinA179]